jgi:hypothetical protein
MGWTDISRCVLLHTLLDLSAIIDVKQSNGVTLTLKILYLLGKIIKIKWTDAVLLQNKTVAGIMREKSYRPILSWRNWCTQACYATFRINRRPTSGRIIIGLPTPFNR